MPNSLDLADALMRVLLHCNQQASRIQNSVVMGALQGLYPGVSPIVRHIHIRSQHRDCITNAP